MSLVLTFSEITKFKKGIIFEIIYSSYKELILSDEDEWSSHIEKWKKIDEDAFNNPNTIGKCCFISLENFKPVGFGSYDPRNLPDYGIIGQNCIIPEARGKGYGKQQILEIIRILKDKGARKVKVETSENVFFLPAQRTYISCGFVEKKRYNKRDGTKSKIIEYELKL